MNYVFYIELLRLCIHISMCSGDQGGVYCDLESAAAGTVGQRAAWPHKNY